MKGRRETRAGAWNGEIGPLLKEARQRRGVSLKEAEKYTSIRWRYLEGLEREDSTELPGRKYTQGFLRSYAEFLGLDAEELARSLGGHERDNKRRVRRSAPAKNRLSPTRKSQSESDQTAFPRARRGGLNGGALLLVSLIVLSLGLVVTTLYLLQSDTVLSGAPVDGDGSPVESSPGGGGPGAARSTTAEPTPTLEEPGSGTPSQAEGLRARVVVRGSESWISVESDGRVEYTGVAQPGFSRSFYFDEGLRITTGNAGAVELRINGLEYGTLGDSGEVRSRSFTLKRE